MRWYILIIAVFNTAIIMGMVYKIEQIRRREENKSSIWVEDEAEDDVVIDDDGWEW